MSRRLWVGAALTLALALGSLAAFMVDESPTTAAQPITSVSATPFVTKGCVGCHELDDQPSNSQVGPDLTSLDKVAAYRVEGLTAEEYVRQSIRQPQAYVVPGYPFSMPTLSLSDVEVDQIVALLLAPDD